MAAISKISNSLVSGVNENNFGFGYANIDFSLIRVNVPKEYLPIAEAMSLERRDDAEYGPLHQTARTLGALFYQPARADFDFQRATWPFPRRKSRGWPALGWQSHGTPWKGRPA